MRNKVEIKIVRTDEDYAGAMQIRRDVFVNEQSIPESHEFDGNDHCATHVLALDEGKPVGTMRIRYFNGFVKFERMCIAKPYRKSDLSEQIMHEGMIFAASKGYEKVYGVCKKELLPRWSKDGFRPIEGAKTVEQNGMTLVPVWCPLPKVDNVITLETAPEILNAREGEWFTSQDNDKTNTPQSSIKKLMDRMGITRRPADIKIDPTKLTLIRKGSSQEY